ncbi:MAG: heparinase II/III family protein, partial [Methylobacteriaceae bacterium]|nr:heparinase II/III family protein [Methylobacteriaceae bacterium]
GGGLLAGEDRLISERDDDRRPADATLRFHLHPFVKVARGETAASLLLLPPNGPPWAFTAEDGTLALEESVFHGGPDGWRPTLQLVLRHETSPLDRSPRVRWRFERRGG